MHIAMLADLDSSGTPSGGVQCSVLTLAVELVRGGTQVTLITASADASIVRTETVEGVTVIRTPTGGRLQLLTGFRGWTRRAHSVLRDLAPDIVHAHGTLHHGSAAIRWHDCPRVVTAHGNPIEDARWHYPAPVRAAVIPLLKRASTSVVRDADLVIGVSADWRLNCPVEPANFEHVPNAIKPCFFAGSHDAAEPIAAALPRVLFAGGSRRIKGLDLLLAAWPTVARAIQGATLDLIGVETLPHRALPSFARTRIRVRPPLDSPGLALEFARGSVLVVPSRFEVSPLVIAEAWASCLPVVATRVGGVPTMAEGLATLCDPEPHDLARALIDVLAGNAPALEARDRARLAANRFTPTTVASAHAALYSQLLASADGTHGEVTR